VSFQQAGAAFDAKTASEYEWRGMLLTTVAANGLLNDEYAMTFAIYQAKEHTKGSAS
jgi:hypothetical protein